MTVTQSIFRTPNSSSTVTSEVVAPTVTSEVVAPTNEIIPSINGAEEVIKGYFICCLNGECYGHVIYDSNANDYSTACGCDELSRFSDGAGHIRVTFQNFRHLIRKDHTSAHMIGRCGGLFGSSKNDGLPLAVNKDLMWNGVRLLKMCWPTRYDFVYDFLRTSRLEFGVSYEELFAGYPLEMDTYVQTLLHEDVQSRLVKTGRRLVLDTPPNVTTEFKISPQCPGAPGRGDVPTYELFEPEKLSRPFKSICDLTLSDDDDDGDDDVIDVTEELRREKRKRESEVELLRQKAGYKTSLRDSKSVRTIEKGSVRLTLDDSEDEDDDSDSGDVDWSAIRSLTYEEAMDQVEEIDREISEGRSLNGNGRLSRDLEMMEEERKRLMDHINSYVKDPSRKEVLDSEGDSEWDDDEDRGEDRDEDTEDTGSLPEGDWTLSLSESEKELDELAKKMARKRGGGVNKRRYKSELKSLIDHIDTLKDEGRTTYMTRQRIRLNQ